MPLVDIDLGFHERGLFLEVIVSVSAMDRKRLGLPADIPEEYFQNYTAQIDTGATTTGITSRVVRDLSLVDYGIAEVGTASGLQLTRRRAIALFLLGGSEDEKRLLDDLSVLEFADLGDGVDVLIGMDVLEHCVLHYNGKRRCFQLAFNQ